MVFEQKKAIEVFFSYSHKDTDLRDQLETQLSLLERHGFISSWHNRKISAGKEWAGTIDAHLNTAKVILLLVSADFIASSYCYDIEMKRALERHNSGEALVIPIILRPCDWHYAPFGKLKALPTDGKPIIGRDWHNIDEALYDVAKGIRKAIEELAVTYFNDAVTEDHITASEMNRSLEVTSSTTTNKTTAKKQHKDQVNRRIFVVDDDDHIVELIRLGLKYEGFLINHTKYGQKAVENIIKHKSDLVILDIFLPDLDGLEVCHRLRSNPITRDIPILMLTSKDDVSDRVTGLDKGADDYLTKPFDFDELVARINAILRRHKRGKAGEEIYQTEDQVLTFEDLQLNTVTHEVTRAGRQIELSSTEYNLLLLFMAHPRQVLDRLTILNRVWGYDFMGETSIVEVYIRYLREKIEDTPSNPRLIQTIRGSGYILKG